ncbi:MAG: PhnD/SsuA/transferrin family substrate-binding protein, partial [Campylobacterota bacterium]
TLQAQTLRFSPLPMYKSELVIKQYQGMFDYLKAQTGFDFEIIYYPDYDSLLQAIKEGKTDLAYLGPLPYASLLQQTDTTTPIVQFLDSKGQTSYTCSFITSKANENNTQNQSYEPLSLTQPLSTCGYFSIYQILQKQGLELSAMNYSYAGTHSAVVLEILLGESTSGGVKTSQYYTYKHLGLHELQRTDRYPGFLLVGSKNITPKQTAVIQKALTRLDYFNNPGDRTMMQTWGADVRYGCKKADKSMYDKIKNKLQNITIPELQ